MGMLIDKLVQKLIIFAAWVSCERESSGSQAKMVLHMTPSTYNKVQSSLL